MAQQRVHDEAHAVRHVGDDDAQQVVHLARQRQALDHLGPDLHRGDERGGTLRRTLRFADFAQAFAFMTQVAIVADKRDHPPEWSNVYDRVDILLTTHDAPGLSMCDIDLACFMATCRC
jgi:4a-hydroxytetrahydrobiopterin dehydratase